MKIDVSCISYLFLNTSYDTCTVHDAICDTMIKRHLHFLLVFIIKKSHLFFEEGFRFLVSLSIQMVERLRM